jgi:hypothetical protein
MKLVPLIHQCNLHCHSIDPLEAENMNIKDKGKWLPFSFHMDSIMGCKLTTDDEDEPGYLCTSVYTHQGDCFIIDTPFNEFNKLFIAFNQGPVSPTEDTKPSVEL